MIPAGGHEVQDGGDGASRRGAVRGALAEFPGAIVSVSHDRLYLEQVCTRVLELTEGGLREVVLE